ncbi:MAG: DNA adenine methylase [Caldilineaceae bacterium]|nr:DNA adenine methylase [Caldilineaceae bacterium]
MIEQLDLLPKSQRKGSAHLDVFRPIHYLGTKTRALDALCDSLYMLDPQPQTVLDLFAGTSVVSQAFGNAGYNVVSMDAMAYSAVFARALLGVGRLPTETNIDASLLQQLRLVSYPTLAQEAFEPWLLLEAKAIIDKDPTTLIEVSQNVPQCWRAKNATTLQQRIFLSLIKNVGAPAFSVGLLVSAFYAGTYFGITQAIEIDRLLICPQELVQLE